MSHSDYTRNILNIKDENITFEENCLKTIKVFHGKLTYTPHSCSNCGCLYESNPDTIIKYDFKNNCKIKIPKISNYYTILNLDKQRFFCKYCESPLIATTDLVDFRKQIFNNTKTTIKLELMEKGSRVIDDPNSISSY